MKMIDYTGFEEKLETLKGAYEKLQEVKEECNGNDYLQTFLNYSCMNTKNESGLSFLLDVEYLLIYVRNDKNGNAYVDTTNIDIYDDYGKLIMQGITEKELVEEIEYLEEELYKICISDKLDNTIGIDIRDIVGIYQNINNGDLFLRLSGGRIIEINIDTYRDIMFHYDTFGLSVSF